MLILLILKMWISLRGGSDNVDKVILLSFGTFDDFLAILTHIQWYLAYI